MEESVVSIEERHERLMRARDQFMRDIYHSGSLVREAIECGGDRDRVTELLIESFRQAVDAYDLLAIALDYPPYGHQPDMIRLDALLNYEGQTAHMAGLIDAGDLLIMALVKTPSEAIMDAHKARVVLSRLLAAMTDV